MDGKMVEKKGTNEISPYVYDFDFPIYLYIDDER